MSSLESSSRGAFRQLKPDELGKLSSLARVTQALSKMEGDFLEQASGVLENLLETVGAERLAVLMDDPEVDNLYRHLTKEGEFLTEPFKYSTTVVSNVKTSGAPVLSVDAMQDTSFSASHSIQMIGARSVMCVPLRGIGQLYVDNLIATGVFLNPELSLLTILADLLASAMERAHNLKKLADANVELRASQEETVTRLAVAADWRDSETAQHIERVGHYSAKLAEWSGCDAEFVDEIRLASKMHDVGKLGVPDAILRKPGRFTDEEFAEMKRHTIIGGTILEGSVSPLIVMAHSIALTHHERYDGKGYPNGIAGEAIPLEGRIVCICDAFDAMASKRCYKEAYPFDKVFGIIQEELGRQFDPRLGQLFLDHRAEVEAIKLRFSG